MANGISLDNLNQNNLIIEQFITPKSAVQRLDETKANYVKSDNVLINDLNRTKSIELINKLINRSDNLIVNDLENSSIKTNSHLNNQINNQLNLIPTDKIQSNNNNNYFKNFNQQLKSKEDCLLNSLLNREYNKPLTSIILSNNLDKKFNSNQSNQFLNNNHKINSPIKYRKHLNKDNRKETNQINLETQLIKLICIDQNEEELPNFSSSLPSSSNSERLSNCSRPSSICSSPISSLITKKKSSILNKPLPKPPIQKDAIKLQKKSTNRSILSTSIQTVNLKLPSMVCKTSKAILSTKFPSALKVCSKVNSKICSKLNSVNSKLSKSTSCLRISSPSSPKKLENNLTQQVTKSSTELNIETIQATKNQLNQNNKINNNDLTIEKIDRKLTNQNNDKELNTIKNVLSLNENIDLKQPVLIEKVENQQLTVKSNLPITPVINRNLKDKLNEQFLKPKNDVPIVASITKNESKTTNQLNNLENKQIIENNEFKIDVKIDLAQNELKKINLQSSLNCCLENNNLKDHELRICLNCSKIEKEFKNLKIQPVCLNKTSSALKEELKNLNNQINQFINNEQKTIELKQSIPVSRSKSDVSHRLNRIINQTKFNEPDIQRVYNTIGLDSSLIYKLNLNNHQQQQNQYLINNLSASNTNLYNSAIYKPSYQTNYQMINNHLNKNSNQPYLSNSQLYCNQSTVDSYYTLDSSNAPKQQLMYTTEFINGSKTDYWINNKQNDFKHQFTIDNSKIDRLELNNNNKQSIQSSSFKNEKSSLVNQQTNQLNNLQKTTNLITTNIVDPNLTIQFNSINNLTDTTTNKFNNNIKFINQNKQSNSNLIVKPLISENDLDSGEISIIERNARVIKWLYQNKKYYDNSV